MYFKITRCFCFHSNTFVSKTPGASSSCLGVQCQDNTAINAVFMNFADLVESTVLSTRVAWIIILHGFTMILVYKDTAKVVFSQCLSFQHKDHHNKPNVS